jgi:hypothetical protein
MKSAALPKFAAQGVFYSQWAYWSSLAGAAMSVVYIPAGSIRTFVILTPLLTAILCAAVASWVYSACDEYVRTRILRAITITALAVALGSLGYFCLELLGFPRQSMIWVSILGWSAFNLQILIVIFRASRSEPEPVSFRGASS